MENKNFEYAGWKVNGFVALILFFAVLGGSIYLIVAGANCESMTWGPVMLVSGIVLTVFSLIACKGFMLLEPNEQTQ